LSGRAHFACRLIIARFVARKQAALRFAIAMSPAVSNGDSHAGLAFYNIIDGKPRSSKTNEQVVDPRTEESLWDVPIATAQDLDDAVDAANRAFKTWKYSSQADRQKVLQDLADCLRTNKDLLAHIHAKETGKSIIMASADVEVSALHYEYYSTAILDSSLRVRVRII
jgi:acyl-CoA reductase-like NAD-dependent aldehyde dehydrogenase